MTTQTVRTESNQVVLRELVEAGHIDVETLAQVVGLNLHDVEVADNVEFHVALDVVTVTLTDDPV